MTLQPAKLLHHEDHTGSPTVGKYRSHHRCCRVPPETHPDPPRLRRGVVLEAINAQRELARAPGEQIEAIAQVVQAQWEFWHALGEGRESVWLPR